MVFVIDYSKVQCDILSLYEIHPCTPFLLLSTSNRWKYRQNTFYTFLAYFTPTIHLFFSKIGEYTVQYVYRLVQCSESDVCNSLQLCYSPADGVDDDSVRICVTIFDYFSSVSAVGGHLRYHALEYISVVEQSSCHVYCQP